MTNPATGSGTGVAVVDIIQIQGQHLYATGSPPSRTQSFKNFSNPLVEVTTSSVTLYDQDISGGAINIRWIVEPGTSLSTNNFTVRATNGANYAPPIQDWSAGAATLPYQTTPNLWRWSNEGQPEHWPSPNEGFIGKGAVIAVESTRDAVWVFCSDGLYRISGAGGVWRVDPMDLTLVLASPRASCVLKEAVYAYTNQGFVRITDVGIDYLSDDVIDDLLPGAEFTETTAIEVCQGEAESEVVLRVDGTKVFTYSARHGFWSNVLFADVTAMAYTRYPNIGAPAVTFGRSPAGVAPRFAHWSSTSSFLAPTARMQPFYGKDPFTQKSWSDGTFVFDAASAGKSLTPIWNDVAAPAAPLLQGGRFYNESRATFGVPRRAATGIAIAPGFSLPAGAVQSKFFGFSVHGVKLGEQVIHR